MAAAHWLETYWNMSDEELSQESKKLAAQLEELQSSLAAETDKRKQGTYNAKIHKRNNTLFYKVLSKGGRKLDTIYGYPHNIL